MSAATLPVAKALAAAFPWGEYEAIIDVGGADCIDWMRDAGFHDMWTETLTDDQSMLVGYR